MSASKNDGLHQSFGHRIKPVSPIFPVAQASPSRDRSNRKASTTDPENQADSDVSIGYVFASQRQAVESADSAPTGYADPDREVNDYSHGHG
jgi:hypothetical protein